MLNNEGNFWTPSKQISETSPHVVHGRNGLREGDSFCCFRYALAAREKPRANVPAMSKAKGALAAKVLIRRPLGTHDEPPLEFGCCDRPPYPYALCGPFFRHEYASEICLNRASASSLTWGGNRSGWFSNAFRLYALLIWCGVALDGRPSTEHASLYCIAFRRSWPDSQRETPMDCAVGTHTHTHNNNNNNHSNTEKDLQKICRRSRFDVTQLNQSHNGRTIEKWPNFLGRYQQKWKAARFHTNALAAAT